MKGTNSVGVGEFLVSAFSIGRRPAKEASRRGREGGSSAIRLHGVKTRRERLIAVKI